ncbi:MAG TPA: hypothetical protein VEC38_03560 [Candidatus Binataceae bacterium]|nr:hypothetical protein [Candidatus Binataceae bacterium]
MQFTLIPTPGAAGGPCRGSCMHPRCLRVRELAARRCPQCLRLLGFGAKISGDPPMHLRCAGEFAAMQLASDPALARGARGSRNN